ncbi:spore photoproduct lyase [Desulfocucumis palustris]|uniref:Spore photoproduct lyase n=1 Tax=Desulfocucumis palustris TaxID=1898651 RepID=A0A2L2X7K9_9FIRM|nr:spore photoproduct lyase [Desulfocucumis palustris]GBF32068.1 spore photoproduct lyase [Desulfocucumis palustris]
MPFTPKRVFFEKDSLQYTTGKNLHQHFKKINIPVQIIGSHNRVSGIPGKTPQESYLEAKRTLVVGVRRTLKFESCKPSAHYQLPLSTSCSGKCEYCYLQTTLGNKPYVRVYINTDEILSAAGEYIKERAPEITIFEGAATSDPLPVERYTGSLKKAIEYFGNSELGRFRFVTKFTEVESLLDARHNGHTRFRFSINTPHVIRKYEHDTPPAAERIEAARKVAEAGYPLGFLIAPIIIYPGWEEDYTGLIHNLKKALGDAAESNITFELISHRFTARAKKRLLEVFPDSGLPLEEEERKFKYGQFGYGKYVYPKERLQEMDSLFSRELERNFPGSRVKYLV